MATNHATHAAPRVTPMAMPRTTEATAATVYAVNDTGTVCQRCIRCQTWAPAWALESTTIKIGTLIRMRNPRQGMAMANGCRDERGMLVFPKIKTGHGCPACVEEFTRLTIRSARDPYIKVDVV